MGIPLFEEGIKAALEIMMEHLLNTDDIRIQTKGLPGETAQPLCGMPGGTVYGSCKKTHVLDRCIDGEKAEQGQV